MISTSDETSVEQELDNSYSFTEENIKRIKEKFSGELRNAPDNPVRLCMELVYQSATATNKSRRHELSVRLSEFLIEPRGVMTLFLALIDSDISSQKYTTLIQRYQALANIITALPGICLPYKDYCVHINRQLESLLISQNESFSSLGGIIFKSLIESQHAKEISVTGILLQPYFQSLTKPSADQPLKPHEAIIAIHTMVQNHVPIESFITIFRHLFYALYILKKPIGRLKNLARDTIVRILTSMKPGAACCLIESLLHTNQKVYKFQIYEEDGDSIIDVIDDLVEMSKELIDRDKIKSTLLDILRNSMSDLLILEFFFHFQEIMWTSTDNNLRHLSASLLEPLIDDTLEESDEKFDLLVIICNHSDKSLELVSRTFVNYLNLLKSTNKLVDPLKLALVNPSVKSCLDILDVLLASSMSSDKRVYEMKKRCLPILMQILDALKARDGKNLEFDHDEDLIRHIQTKITMLENAASQDDAESELELKKKSQFYTKELNEITNDLNDKLVPSRVHGLVRLKSIIITNDTYVMYKIPQLFTLVECSLADDEPYVFLACINLISEMAIRKTKEILPKLVSLHSDRDLTLQHRINAGEAIIRTIKQLQDLTPFYANDIVRTFLNGCEDQEELIRISSLTNLGEVCRNLGHSLQKYIVEMLICIEKLLCHDSIQVKCAVVDLLRTTISGIQRQHVETVQHELRSIYKMLKSIKTRTIDEKLCVQISLALDEIDRLVKDIIMFDVTKSGGKDATANSIVKNIKVLSLIDRK